MLIKTALYTLEIAFFSTLIAVAIGVSVAFFTAKRQFPGRKFLLSLSAIPLSVPALIVALGYISVFGMNGFFNTFLKKLFSLKDSPLQFLYSAAGIILAQGFYNFPIVTSVVSSAWENLSKDQEKAARLSGAGTLRVFFTVTLPRLSGAVAAGAIPVFLFCFFSFMIVLVFSPVGKSTLEVEIYRAVRATLDVKSGTGLALLETVFALMVVWLYTFISRKSQAGAEEMDFSFYKKPGLCHECFELKSEKLFEMLFFMILLILLLIFFFAPASGILISAFTKKVNNHSVLSLFQFKSLLKNVSFLISIKNTILIGISTGFLCVLISFIYAAFVKIKGKQKKLVFQILPLIPMAISSVVLSWCVSLVFHKGNVFLLVLMQTFLYWPVSCRQIQNGINQVSFETDKACCLLSKNAFDSVFRVYLPSCKKVIFSGFCYTFAMSAGDATLPLVLSIPKFTTLALYTYRLSSSYRFNQACASGVFLSVLCILMFRISNHKFNKKGQN